jgi:hypothetical protein
MRHLLVIIVALVALVPRAGLGAVEAGAVFFDPAQIPAFRERFASDPLFADLKAELESIDREAEREFLRTEVRYNDHLYDIARIGNLAQKMALLYVYSGDKDAAQLARECVESIMKFPRWDYFLEGGTKVFGLQRAPNSALAVALTIEAMGDLLPLQDRTRWLKVLAERGIEPCWLAVYGMRYPDRVTGWGFDTTSTYLEHRPADRGLDLSRWPIILNTINLKAIPASVLALSALTYRKYMGENDDTDRWIEQAIYSISTFKDIYAQDGSYNEGVSYANYTTIHLIQAIDALKRTGVADLTDLLNWPGYQQFLLEMMMPTKTDPYAIVNFSDAGPGASSAAPFWIARETRDGLAQWFGVHFGRERDIWSLLWYDPTVAPEPPPECPHLWHSDLDWIVGRTGFDLDDLMVAMRSGPPYNHEHADRNSIVLNCFGERLVADPMRPPYSFADPAWVMRLTSGHSAILIDGKGHQYVDGREGTNSSQAQARIVRSGERTTHLFWTSDATQAYQLVMPDVRSVTRTVVMLTTLPAVVVVDKVIKASTPSRIQARFFCFNNDGNGSVVADESGFTILRPTALLGGYSIAQGGVSFASHELPIPEETARMHPFAEVSTTVPALETCLVTVLLPFEKEAGAGSIQLTREGGLTKASIGDLTRSIEILVHEDGGIPTFEVR